MKIEIVLLRKIIQKKRKNGYVKFNKKSSAKRLIRDGSSFGSRRDALNRLTHLVSKMLQSPNHDVTRT